MLNNLHFLHPEWLWLLLVLPLVLGMKWFQARQQGGWERIVDKQLMPFVLSGTAGSWGWLPLAWLSLALLVAIVAMAGPAWEKREVPVFRDQQALVVAMDFSASMYADDEKPNRITLARFKLLDILNARQDAQNGLVVFAGDAFVVTPLTDDIATIQEQVKNLAPDIMPAPGSLLTPAIERSVELLQQAGMKTGSILLMTDGVADTESAVAAADKAWSMGYNVSVLSLGTADGAAIPRPRGGFLLDNWVKR
ncbi:VWA domain-containing protein [Thiothrix subterranea]|uniref:VWA domain-containing protein n=1 Tax=Thiothrix subterranea TaxID=2735563 RepID=UPI00280BF0DC|nr:VWA domain-containing protein [Thiothrix subterranea]